MPWAVMRLAQSGFQNTVALLGTTLSSVQADWLSKAPSILLMLDGDDAGRKALKRIVPQLKSKSEVYICNLSNGKEPEDYSHTELRSIVNNAL